jgi:hypothetical protein
VTVTLSAVAEPGTIRARIEEASVAYPLAEPVTVDVTEAGAHAVVVVPDVAAMVAWTEHLCGDWRAEARLDAGRLWVRVHGECRLLGWAVSVVPMAEPVEVTP